MYVIGIDIGGTTLKGAVFDKSGRIIHTRTVSTEANLGFERVLGNLYILVDQLLEVQPGSIAAIGIGSAGRINVSTGKVVFATSNLPGWHGLELGKTLSNRYHLPVVVDNDANTAALGEYWVGAGDGAASLVLLTLGTGVGGGIISNGEVVRGHHWSAGELGHTILYPHGHPCNCGQFGCVEQYVSGTALLRAANSSGEDHYETGADVLYAFSQGNKAVVPIVYQFVQDLGFVLFNVQNCYDPETIVLGGGVADSRLYFEHLLSERLVSFPIPIHVKYAMLGNQSGMIGAAKLAWGQLDSSLNRSTGGFV